MTFIASVIAQDGVAMVTDSFVTTPTWSLEWDDLRDHLATSGKASITIDEIKTLFEARPSHTRNYAEKLFEFGSHSAITTSGHAYINNKGIQQIIMDILAEVKQITGYPNVSIDTILDSICFYLDIEARAHIKNRGYIGKTSFIFSHYNVVNGEPAIFKIIIYQTSDNDILNDASLKFVTWLNVTGYKIVTDGQDIMIDRLLFGSLYTYDGLIDKYIADEIAKELKLKKNTRIKLDAFIKSKNLLRSRIDKEIGYIKRRPLSLQEAVDFAALLVRIVINIQQYSEKIPTVGGLIKLAVVNKEGIKHINGHEIIKPNLIY